MANLTTIWDQTSSGIKYSSDWIKNEDSRFFGGSYTWADSTGLDPNASASLTYSFRGTTISFWGVTPFTPNTKPLTITIDNKVETPPSFLSNGESDGTYTEIYRSPVIEPGLHNISFSNFYGVYLDFILVYGDPVTNGSVMLVDDTDPAVQYRGNWNVGKDETFSTTSSAGLGGADPGRDISGIAMGNGTHATKNVGDGFSVNFNGTELSVYGIIDSHSNGTIHVTFTIDGESSTSVYQIPGPSIDPGGGLLNHLLYHNASIAKGPHKLDAEVASITGDQSLIFDYLTYRHWVPPANYTSPGSISGGNNNGNGMGGATPSPVPSDHRRKPVGSIIGAVIGSVLGVLTLGIIAICLLVRWRRKRTAKKIREMTVLQPDPWISDRKTRATNNILTSETYPAHRKTQEAHAFSVTDPDEEMIRPGRLMCLTSEQSRNEGVREQPVSESSPSPLPRATLITELEPQSASDQSSGAQTDISELASQVNILTREVQRLRSSFSPFFAPPLYNNTGESGATSPPSYAHGESR
ncbi:hypothetical protein E1B28_010704 [Marasmius oreades]|uniref:Uncharacterized protein n=1 Tax=Marasmius oreades TaxID=181124 RepID=A0A9P7US19_9AGAR|nr:uncharacterized protein E1B28_010704 [Marasmius oreades]KAG7091685.1 hypothetical protein E1B28_010704 [Marasmius oreades]